MHVVPRSHIGGTPKHTSNVSAWDPSAARKAAVCVALAPGDALLFHGDVLHGTPPNVTHRRRRALQLHYADATCRPSDRRALVEHGDKWSRAVGSPNLACMKPPDDGAGFDCAPSQEGGVCYEPQFWHFRRAELVVRGQAQGGRCI
jgi:hypothetical protein